MSNEVRITISGDDAKMLSAWQRQTREVLKLQKQLTAMGDAGEASGNKIGSSMEKAGTKGTTALEGIVSTLKSATAGFVGIAGVIKGVHLLVEQIKREYEHLRAQQSRAGQAQVNLAPLEREVFENLGNDKTLPADKVRETVARISERTSASPAAVYQNLSTALSFKERSATAASVLPLVEMSAGLYPENAEAASANTKALQALAKVGNKAKAADLQGFLIGAKLASPVVNNENFAAYTAPAIAQLASPSLGNTFREAAAFQGALGQGIGDEEGRITANASINFAKQLKEETARFGVQGGVFQQLGFLQTEQGKGVKAKLLGPLMKEHAAKKKIGLEGEAKAFATLIGFLQGEGRYADILQGTLADTPELEGAESYLKERQAAVGASPIQKQARLDRLLESAGARAELTQLGAGKQGITLGRFKEVLTKSGATEGELSTLEEAFKVRTEGTPEGIIPKLAQGIGLIGTPGEKQSPEYAASQLFNLQAGRLERGERYTISGGTVVGDPSAEMLEAAKVLRTASEMLEEGVRKGAAQPQAKAGPGAANQRR